MSSEAILISVSLLLVALAILGLAVSISRSKPSTQVSQPQPDDVETVETVEHLDDAPANNEVLSLAPFTVVKEEELANGEFEVLVDWGPNSVPSAFRGATLKEAIEKAHGVAAAKRSMQNMRDDY